MSDSERALRLHAALDGELDAMASLALEREMDEDPALAAEYRRLAALREAVRHHASRDEAPSALVDRIAELAADAPLPAPVVAAVVPIRRRAWLDQRALAMAASLGVLGFVAGAGLMSLRTGADQHVASGLVADFSRAAIAGQPFDVASSDRHTVKPWLAAHATVSADIADLTHQGFTLEGGRIAVVDRVPAPTLVYRHNEHLVAVTELPLNARAAASEAIETIDGFHVARWSGANLAYVAVSDMDEKTLAEFVAAFEQAQKPAGEGTAK
jgi:anti-sigma factor RsiW